jgi:tyrosyl-tRNA synthetase
MALLGRLPRPKLYVCRRCIAQRAVKLSTSSRRSGGHWAAPNPDHAEYWKLQAGRIRDGSQKSMLQILEERGFVKDVAG